MVEPSLHLYPLTHGRQYCQPVLEYVPGGHGVGAVEMRTRVDISHWINQYNSEAKGHHFLIPRDSG